MERANGWQLQSETRKRDRIRELLLQGFDATEIAGILYEERGCGTHRSEVSVVRSRLVRAGKMEVTRNGRAIAVDGVRFPSINAAALAHGVSRQCAHKRFTSASFPTWVYLED